MKGDIIEGKSILRRVAVDLVSFSTCWRNVCKDIELFCNYFEIISLTDATLRMDHGEHSCCKFTKHIFTEHDSVPSIL